MITSQLLSSLGIVHGYSTRTESREQLFEKLHIRNDAIAQGEQIHGVKIVKVTDKDKGRVIIGTDGLVSNTLPIGVTFADCVPILAVDPISKIIGTAHAGWKGTLAEIAPKLINAMQKHGADIDNIYISVGPHIGMCCYNVPDERARVFQNQFGNDKKIAARIGDEWYVDIGYVNYIQLLKAGIAQEHIDAPPTCTSCQVAEFHSFRKDPKEKFGVQLGVIRLESN